MLLRHYSTILEQLSFNSTNSKNVTISCFICKVNKMVVYSGRSKGDTPHGPKFS